jgi:hypothetical protein
VSIVSRCPRCQAAVPSGAAWCSLCHRDLRPEPVASVPPGSGTTDLARGEAPAAGASARRGRHARPDDDHVGTASEPGRPGTAGRHSTAALGLLEGVAVPRAEEAGDEEVEAYADAMLTRLRVADPAPRLADPGSFPGGRWGLAAVAMIGMTLVLLALGAVAGAVLG